MLIEQDALKYWTNGSFEWLRQETVRAIKEGKQLCEINFGWQLIATYPNHAIIVSDKGDFYRCKLQEVKDFERKLVGVEKITGPKVYREGEERAYYAEKTSGAVAGMLEGRDVGDLVAALMCKDTQLGVARAITEQLQTLVDGRTLWSSYYGENEHRIVRANWRHETVKPSVQSPSEIGRRTRLIAARAQNVQRGLGNEQLVEAAASIVNNCDEIDYWISKIYEETELPSAYGVASQGLIECLHRMDMVVAYAEGHRARR